MLYQTTKELPDRVRENLPEHAQEIYKEAYNSAWDQYDEAKKRQGGAGREETAHKVAWAAVKRSYKKDNKSGKWKKKDNK